jgi:thiamine-monophosphate kinase
MESELIAWLREHLPPHPLLRLGLGDDAAVLRMANVEECAITVDLLSDHVDFKLDQVDPRRIGRKALAVNLSDIAAMAAEPLACVVALLLPRQQGKELAVSLYEGLIPLAERYHVAIAGGDTNSWDGPLAISITMLGKTTDRDTLKRSGAQPGDRILVTGSFGGSILNKHLDFEPRVREALQLNARYTLHAGIDVSDGLSCDLNHIVQESGCGAVVNLNAVPVADDAHRWAKQLADGSTPLDHALSDGEDFELILAVPPDDAKHILTEQPLSIPITDIGEFIATPGLWQRDDAEGLHPLVPRGWQHG